MQPDLGTPGMATYVEFIGERDRTNFFGTSTERYWLNNGDPADEIEVSFRNPEDGLVIGPVVNTWQNRLLSTIIFVSPDYTPQSGSLTQDWETSVRKTIDVSINGSVLASYDFYIVIPQSIWGNLGGKSVFGEGTGNEYIGKMSPRNAIIVDSLDLGAGLSYRFSKNDPDPSTPGNEAYLPVTLLSVGPIVGGTGTIIDVSTNDKNGGPGGGGGAGIWCDFVGTSSSGGEGFTGGAGGGHRPITGNVTWRDAGNGSGNTGYRDVPSNDGVLKTRGGESINGVTGGEIVQDQGGGGGTGHPFGESGVGWNEGGTVTSVGYGGGSGGKERTPGGHAGYASEGLDTGNDNGQPGNRHGNDEIVPLAGGSGGSTGNPQPRAPFFLPECSGDGGGGGGALRIFAPLISNININASGANGGSSDANDSGGAGSGGAVDINAKTDIASVSADVQGGANGGYGYIRANFRGGTVARQPSLAPLNYRVSSDTTKYIQDPTNYNITGFKPPNSTLNAFLWVDGEWNYIGDVTGAQNDYDYNLTEFSQNGDFSYFVPLYSGTSSSTGLYDYDPALVFSQSGWNILRADPQPDIIARNFTIELPICGGDEVVLDSIKVVNNGTADFTFDFDPNSDFPNDGGYEYLGPTGNVIVPAQDSIYLQFRFTFVSGEGSKTAAMVLKPLDPNQSDIRVIITINPIISEIQYLDMQDNPITELDLGDVCVDSTLIARFKVVNKSLRGAYEFLGTGLRPGGPNPLIGATTFVLTDGTINASSIPRNDTTIVTANIITSGRVDGGTPFGITSIQCPEDTTYLQLNFNVIRNQLVFDNIGDQNFGPQLVNVGGERRILLRNNGNGTIELNQDPPAASPEFIFSNYEPVGTQRLAPGDSVTLVYTFRPNQLGVRSTNFNWIPDPTDQSCFTELAFSLTGRGIEQAVGISDDIFLDTLYHCIDVNSQPFIYNFDATNVVLKNQGTDLNPKWYDIDQTSDFFNNTPRFESAIFRSDGRQVTITDNVLSQNDTVYVDVLFDPDEDARGLYEAEVIFEVYPEGGDPNNATEISMFIRGVVDSLQYTTDESDGVNDRILDFGEIPLNTTSAPMSVDIELLSSLQRVATFQATGGGTIDDIRVTPASATLTRTNPTRTFDITVEALEFNNGVQNTVDYSLQFINNCGESEQFFVRYNVIRANLLDPQELILGVHAPCDSVRIVTAIRNTGKVSATIDSMKVDTFQTRIFNAPDGINVAANSDDDIPEFVISASDLGLGDFVLPVKIYTTENGELDSLEFNARGRVSNGFDPNPVVVDLGRVVVGNTVTFSELIAKEPGMDISLDVFTDGGENPGILTITNPNDLESPLLAGDFNIDFEFTPTAVGLFQSTAQIEYTIQSKNPGDPDCPLVLPITFTGEAVPGASITFRAEEFVDPVDPLAGNIDIPIYAQITEGVSTITLDQINGLGLTFNKTLFDPEEISEGTMRVLAQTGDDATIGIDLTNVTITDTENVLTTISGRPMLGNSQRTDLTIDLSNLSILPEGLVSDTTAIDGVLTIIVCEDDEGVRLLDYVEPFDVTVSQHAEVVALELSAPYTGDYSIEIYDVAGRRLFYDSWQSGGRETLYKYIPKSNIARGLVYLRYVNGLNQKIVPMVLD
ncbi:MAG: hypothetical protein Kapaf2KO_20500 [Candidatus Kapaibacteriales bacterium]